MRNSVLCIFFVGLLAFTSCNKDKYPSIDDLEVNIEMVNEQGSVTTYHIKGDNITFRYTITNISDKTFVYMASPCPEKNFEVYYENGEYFGKPVGNGYSCADQFERTEIGPRQTHNHVVVWTPTAQGSNLSGVYYTTLSSHISMLEGKEHRTYDFDLDFQVR